MDHIALCANNVDLDLYFTYTIACAHPPSATSTTLNRAPRMAFTPIGLPQTECLLSRPYSSNSNLIVSNGPFCVCASCLRAA